MTFHVGQKVVCVCDNWAHRPCGIIFPKKGSLYVIRNMHSGDALSDAYLRFVEIRNQPVNPSRSDSEPAFDQDAFRPVVDRKTDISIFKRMLLPDVIQEGKKREQEFMFGNVVDALRDFESVARNIPGWPSRRAIKGRPA